eukprot:TRINITY_DN5997_c0_g1_i1.p1 TRINITY_DN5997_c0_g1~~TRINITY_DN5997_c0_g1_i1.p1  ORF type:complete len:332 (+),score=100.54 TRINITY_DN5997_c0_g1_i1:58-1053(+)
MTTNSTNPFEYEPQVPQPDASFYSPKSPTSSSSASSSSDSKRPSSPPTTSSSLPPPPPYSSSSSAPSPPSSSSSASSSSAGELTAQNLNFADIPHQNLPQSAANLVSVAISNAPSTQDQQLQQQQPKFYQLAYYQQFFNVDTTTILKRIGSVFLPWKSPPFGPEAEETVADLYAPFWTCCTLVFLMAVTSNLGSYFESSATEWQTDYTTLTFAAGVFFSWITIVPFAFWFTFSYFSSSRPISEMIALFGYSLVPLLPAAILCAIPNNVLRWCVLCICFALSVCYLIHGIWKSVVTGFTVDSDRHSITTTLIIIGCFQAGLFFLTKLYFFSY